VKVIVRNEDVNKALRVLKRKLQQEGVFKEMRKREAYEKPSDKRRREKGEAVRRKYRETMKRETLERAGR
jgi:small subunit ribosomal protein S21